MCKTLNIVHLNPEGVLISRYVENVIALRMTDHSFAKMSTNAAYLHFPYEPLKLQYKYY